MSDELLKTLPAPLARAIQVCTAARELADSSEERGMIRAAGFIARAALQHHGQLAMSDTLAQRIIREYVTHLLDADLFEAAAILLWGPGAFDWRPESCRRVWQGLMW